jgi:hypothetical protein
MGIIGKAGFRRHRFALRIATICFAGCFGAATVPAQQLDTASVIQRVDAAVKARFENVTGYTVTEHYAVYRNTDETHPAAEMTVKTVYQKDTGKSYTPIAQSGSSILRSQVLGTMLEHEKRINQPGIREGAWITSANYEMKLKSGEKQTLGGRECVVLTLTPRRKEPYLFEGTLWVDAKDFSIVQIQGTAASSPSFLTGPAQVFREYAKVSGFAQATHAKAVSTSSLFGRTVVKVDYQGYQVQLRSAQ